MLDRTRASRPLGREGFLGLAGVGCGVLLEGDQIRTTL